jgi:hypothetical protein
MLVYVYLANNAANSENQLGVYVFILHIEMESPWRASSWQHEGILRAATNNLHAIKLINARAARGHDG